MGTLVSQGREVFLEAVSAYAAESGVSLDAIAAQQLQLDTVFTIIRARSPQFYAAHTQNLLNQRGSYDVAAARAVNQASSSKQSRDETAATVPVSPPQGAAPRKKKKMPAEHPGNDSGNS